jgi:uncharacterized membrane protein YraQ (UPF0718 family)
VQVGSFGRKVDMAVQPAAVPSGPSALRRFDFRVPLTLCIIALLCGFFWIGSRYPSLQGKASADPNEALSTPLGFERFFPEPPADNRLKHIGWTAVEWGLTNRQGMTYGLLLAAGMLTLLPLLRRSGGGKLAGAVRGMLVGTPLGVCVNCAAPIAQGMLKGGARVETALATLFSSPIFNVIVLGIVLTIFPWYLAALKILSGLFIVLVIAPWLARLAERPGWTRVVQAPTQLPGLGFFQKLESFLGTPSLVDNRIDPRPSGLLKSLGWVVLHYLRNLGRVLLAALPLMLLAGVAGAVLVEFLPWNLLNQVSRVQGFFSNSTMLVLAAAFGVLLPVPMAFDVIVCSVLLNAGMPVHIVAALLVTLGSYSVYAWSLIGTTLSWRVAAAAGAAIFATGVLAGGAAGLFEHWNDLYQAEQTAQLIRLEVPKQSMPPILPMGRSGSVLRKMAPPLPAPTQLATEKGLELWYSPFESTSGTPGDKEFKRIDGATLGFKRMPAPRPYQTMEPGPMHLSSLAAGDVNDDGWPDVAVGTPWGAYLYINVGGRFELQEINFPEMHVWQVCDVALVDLDGDGALDLYVSTWMHGSHIFFNRGGEFSGDAHVELPRATEICAASTAFADVDRDGLVDIVTGGATFESWYFYPRAGGEPAVAQPGRGKVRARDAARPRGRHAEPVVYGPQRRRLAGLVGGQ